jgi:hypothetical protein
MGIFRHFQYKFLCCLTDCLKRKRKIEMYRKVIVGSGEVKAKFVFKKSTNNAQLLEINCVEGKIRGFKDRFFSN